jgi:DNA-directed RNA polymerase specialized sigma24 family protein
MKLADEMWNQYEKFVRKRIHAEILPFTGGKVYPSFDDLEMEVWMSVARQIERYFDEETPMAWLRTVVHGTVVDHFRRARAAKRGADKTVPLDFDPSGETLPKATRPSGEPPERETNLKTLWSVSGVNRHRK